MANKSLAQPLRSLCLWVLQSGVATVLLVSSGNAALAKDFPRYKPASRAPSAIDIRTNEYGASRSAPNALLIGDQAQDFSAPKAGGGLVALRQLRKDGDVVIIFYRGHW